MTIDDNVKYIYKGTTPVNEIYQGSILVWPKSPTPQRDYSKEYLTFEIVSSGTVSWGSRVSTDDAGFEKTIYYSTDNGSTWNSWSSSGNSSSISLQAGDKIMFKGNNAQYGLSTETYAYFLGSSYFNVYGNIMSLIDGDNFTGSTSLSTGYTFVQLFYNSKVVSAEHLVLPATTLSEYCYYYMFCHCKLVTAPSVLPAATLAEGCYRSMFENCDSMMQAPVISATTLAESSCMHMFYGCDHMQLSPVFAPTTVARVSCYGMFQNCKDLVTPPFELPATTLEQACYQYMFKDCTILETAPELPATATTNYCYYAMFSGCTSLNYVKCLATSSGYNSFSYWLDQVSSSGTLVKPASLTGIPIPTGWTVVNIS